MKFVTTLACALFATSAFGADLELTLADPQPTDLAPGLAVSYFYPPDVKTLEQAAEFAKRATPGAPLAGLDYQDTKEGEKTLTSDSEHHVVAKITGYVKFDAPGSYTVEFLSNDGLQASVGGQEVIFFDGRHPCEPGDPAKVNVPAAGWYDLEALYFQRTGSACLHMLAGIGEPDWMPNSAFGH